MESKNYTLVDAWLQYHQLLEEAGDLSAESGIGGTYLWAIDELDALASRDPEKCWTLILEILTRATSDYQRASLSAGLLEDLLVRHGAQFIDRIEELAKKDSGFRYLLSGVWRRTIDTKVWERLEALKSSNSATWGQI